MSAAKPMTKVARADFDRPVVNKELTQHIPTVAQLPPGDLHQLWQKMPTGAIPKEWIFASAIALFLDHLAEEAKKCRQN